MIKIAAIIRKSPTNSDMEDKAIKKHRDLISAHVSAKYHNIGFEIEEFIDVCSGDDEDNRVNLKDFFSRINTFTEAYCYDVDRFSRSYLGLKWFHAHFKDSTCKLRFLDGTNIYDEHDNIDPEGYLFFFIKCAFAEYELFKIRQRTNLGRQRVLADPKLRKLKYPGKPKGAKDTRPRKTDGYFKS